MILHLLMSLHLQLLMPLHLQLIVSLHLQLLVSLHLQLFMCLHLQLFVCLHLQLLVCLGLCLRLCLRLRLQLLLMCLLLQLLVPLHLFLHLHLRFLLESDEVCIFAYSRSILSGPGHFVPLHLLGDPDLVLVSQPLVQMLLLCSERTPTFSHDVSKINKLDVGVFAQNLRAGIIGKKHVGTTCAFWRQRILGWFPAWSFAFLHSAHNKISFGIMSGGRLIICHFNFKSSLIFESFLFPEVFFFGNKSFVHMRSKLGQLAEGHAWILSFELVSH
mmetsp:Transcript_27673/g.55399  ORF Transcript_27673/g.55399 Transcript_27673/m.55399 type:complete len:273 (-) Transcript_27673:862-1680(-)